MKQRVFLIITIIALIGMPAFAERVAMSPLAIPSVASSGFGGTHVAFTDNVFSIMVNPAAMMHVRQRSFITLSASIFSPEVTREIGTAVMDMVAAEDSINFGDLADTLSRNRGMVTLGAELSGGIVPIHFAWVANGFGFGLWNRTFMKAEIIGDTVRATAYHDTMLPIGFAFRVLDVNRHSIDAGFTLKPFVRVMASESVSIMDLMDGSDFDLGVPVIFGGGLDIGLLYRSPRGFQAGLTFTDVLSRGTVVANLMDTEVTDSFYIPFAMNAGISQSFRLGNVFAFTIAADWRDIGNAFNQTDYLNNRNFLLDLGIGAQIALFNTIFVRAGINEMLPAVGIGLHLGALHIDVAYHGREFGYEPGMLSTAVLDLSFSIRPGAQERNWIWTRNSVLGLFGVGR